LQWCDGEAQLSTSAGAVHLNLPPEGQPERRSRVTAMVDRMEEYFGSCTNYGECQQACPKGIAIGLDRHDEPELLESEVQGSKAPCGGRRPGW